MKSKFPLLFSLFSFQVIWPLCAQELTLKKAVELSFQKSPVITQLQSRAKALMASIRATRGVYDWALNAGINYADQDLTRTVIFQPTNIKTLAYEVGTEKKFAMGTALNVDASLVRQKDDSTFNIFNTRYASELGISVSQSLLDGFWNSPNSVRLQTDQIKIDALNSALWRNLEVLAGEISQNYWLFWRDVKFFSIAREAEDEALAFLTETKRLASRGLRENDEILQAETSWLERKQETLLAQMRMENVWTDIKINLGLSESPDWMSIPDLENPSWGNLGDDSGLLLNAYKERRDFVSAQATLDINKKLFESTKRLSRPNLTARGGYSLLGLDPKARESISQVRKTQIKGWNIGMALRHSFGQNLDYAEIEGAESNLLSAQNEFQRLQQNIEADVKKTANNFKLNLEYFELSQKIENKKSQIKKEYSRKFSQGRVSIRDVLQTQSEERRARSERLAAEANLAVQQIAFKLAHGNYLKEMGFDSPDAFHFLGVSVK